MKTPAVNPRRLSLFVLISAFFLACTTASTSWANPGCWKAIQGKVITDRLAKKLPADCQEFRKTYLKSLNLLSQDSKKFSHDLARQISTKKSFQPPYDALVVSVLASDPSDELKSAIRSRAKIEAQKNFKYKYAMAAQERIEKGTCSATFSEAAYDEVCHAQDQIYSRIEKLRGVKQ